FFKSPGGARGGGPRLFSPRGGPLIFGGGGGGGGPPRRGDVQAARRVRRTDGGPAGPRRQRVHR
ncbi:hypothetical protein E2F47_06660, partial [Mycobacterium eburneum]